jgi:hypothetical protein
MCYFFQAVLASPLNGQFFVIGNPTEILGKYHKHPFKKLTDKGLKKSSTKNYSKLCKIIKMTLNLAE